MSFDPRTLQADYAKQLWTLSNVVCGFAVVQCLSFLYAMKDEAFRLQVHAAEPMVSRAIVTFSIAYVLGIVALDWLQVSIASRLGSSLTFAIIVTTAMRFLTVAASGAGAFIVARN